MLQWVIDSARGARIDGICAVTGFLSGQVDAYLAEHDPDVVPVYQAERKGTGHAVMMAAEFLRSRASGGNVLVMNGDARSSTRKRLRKRLPNIIKAGTPSR